MRIPATKLTAGTATLLAAVLGAGVPSAARAQEGPGRPATPAPFPLSQETRLSNGVRLVLVERPGAPFVSLALSMPGGAQAREPQGKQGVAQVAAHAITRGAGRRSAEEIATAADHAGGSIGAVAEREVLTVSASALAREAALAFELVGDVAVRPTFPEGEVQIARARVIASLPVTPPQRPSAAAAQALGRMIEGDPRPFGRPSTQASLRALTRDDLVTYHRTHLRPQGALLVVAGDLTLAQARMLAERAFAGWTGAPPAPAEQPKKPAAVEVLIV